MKAGLWTAVSCFLAAGLALMPTAEAQTPIPGEATYELIGTYDLQRLEQIGNADMRDFMASSTMPTEFIGKLAKPKYNVKLYRVIYPSVVPELENLPTRASGLVAIPDSGTNTMPLVSYQHGTVFDRTYVPSNPDASMETRIMLLQFAAQGYIVIGADYFGRGQSTLPDSYLVRDSTQQAGVDLYIAARDFLKAQRISVSHFFVSGWSQGGWVSMQYLYKLQSLGVKVSAAAVASAPVDVYLTMNRWMSNPQPVDAVYLPGVAAIQLQSQEFYHRQQGLLEAAVRPEYVQASRDLYAGRIDFETFFKKTPPKLAAFIKPEFAQSGFTGLTPYWQVLQTNQAYRWRSDVPTRVYWGGMDEVTPKAISFLPEAVQSLLGGAAVTTVDAGAKADHRAIYVFGAIDQKAWFDRLAGRN
jgi:pimeloyl-ACP methyl ester carboxylesterase